jgi:hypothetical protein
VRSYLGGLERGDALVVRARLEQIRQRFRVRAPVAPGIFEARVSRSGRAHAVLFGLEGRGGRALVALDAYQPAGRRTPRSRIAAAQDRLARWRARGDHVRAGRPVAHRRELGLGR